MIPAYSEILSLGFLWITLHCAPMCGPIVIGLSLHGTSRSQTLLRLLAYQAGRALVLGSLGAAAGLAGDQFTNLSPVFSWFIVALLSAMALTQWRQYLGFRTRLPLTAKISALFARFMQPRLTAWRGRPFLMGIVLGALPCMLVAWALTVAASTASAFDGAVVMLLLIALTTLPLGLVLLGSQGLKRFQKAWMEPSLLTISAAWTLMMTLGSHQMIPHFHFMFQWWGEHYHFMFW